MSYLQLAENDPFTSLAQNIPTEASEMYVFVPQGYRGSTKDLYIREDLLDAMPQQAFSQMMYELEPYQNTGLSGKGAERRDARRQAREDRKGKRAEARETRSTRRADMFSNLLNKGGEIVSSLTGRGSVDDTTGRSPITGSIDFGTPQEESFLSKYKVPLIIGAVGVIGFVAYKSMNKKRR
jgi:hypothetical protein